MRLAYFYCDCGPSPLYIFKNTYSEYTLLFAANPTSASWGPAQASASCVIDTERDSASKQEHLTHTHTLRCLCLLQPQ